MGWQDRLRQHASLSGQPHSRALPWPGPLHVGNEASRSIPIVVTSTVLNGGAAAAACVMSVRAQTHPNWKHVFIDASSDDDSAAQAHSAADGDPRVMLHTSPRERCALENLLGVWRSLPSNSVIVQVDGDDALSRPDALSIVASMHEAGAWLTYGQFRFANGKIGHGAPIGPRPRQERSWRLCHLRTFRAALFHKLRHEDLCWPDGRVIEVANDELVMIPLAEMARERAVFCPTVLYEYSGFRTTPGEYALEKKALELLRSRAPYQRLELL